VIAIGSYNCENLFDTEDDSVKKDEEFTPKGPYAYTDDVYRAKLHNIAYTISQLGIDVTPDGTAIQGLVEIENDHVLRDLVAQPELKNRNYKYVWFPTPDERGISTAMLYNPRYFTLLGAEPLRVPLETIGQNRQTRNITHAWGVLSGDTVHVMVNHWPSPSGGAPSVRGRKLAASVLKHVIDSLQQHNPETRIIFMGDLNENPTEENITMVLQPKDKTDGLKATDIYNPWISMYRKGMGTESYHGEWNMLDQIMMTGAFVTNPGNGWQYYKAEIFNRDFLVNKVGKDKGLPHRSFTIASVWDNGYSDHFPVVVYFVKKQ